MSAVFLATGDVYLGERRVDENGNEVEVKAPRFESKPHGSCVVVGEIDPESLESVADADIYADWDAAGYFGKILEILQPDRKLNVPDLREMSANLAQDLSELGYRKASDVAREILEKLVEHSTFGLVNIDYAFKIAKEMGVDVKNGKC